MIHSLLFQQDLGAELIAEEPVGENGFGYDPIFLPKLNKTSAQLTDDEKNKISHEHLL